MPLKSPNGIALLVAGGIVTFPVEPVVAVSDSAAAACSVLTDAVQRLACYDHALGNRIPEPARNNDPVSVSTSDARDPGLIWELDMSGRSDSVTIESVIVNRGNCKPQYAPQLPQSIRFGETRMYAYYMCRPIEIQVVDNEGTSAFAMEDGEVQNGLSVSKNDDLYPGLWQLIFTSHADDLTIRRIITNRGNCRLQGVRSETNPSTPWRFKFGQRYTASAVSCDPVEVQVTTDQGVAVFTFNR